MKASNLECLFENYYPSGFPSHLFERTRSDLSIMFTCTETERHLLNLASVWLDPLTARFGQYFQVNRHVSVNMDALLPEGERTGVSSLQVNWHSRTKSEVDFIFRYGVASIPVVHDETRKHIPPHKHFLIERRGSKADHPIKGFDWLELLLNETIASSFVPISYLTHPVVHGEDSFVRIFIELPTDPLLPATEFGESMDVVFFDVNVKAATVMLQGDCGSCGSCSGTPTRLVKRQAPVSDSEDQICL